VIPSHTKEKRDMHNLTATVPDDATLIKDDGDAVIGAVWRGEDNTGPWPGECWKLATVAHGKTVSVRRSESEAIRDVRNARG
jgi:hypothetical protein